jgi:hypothetical protein
MSLLELAIALERFVILLLLFPAGPGCIVILLFPFLPIQNL